MRSAIVKAKAKFTIKGRQPHVAVGKAVLVTLGDVRHFMTEYQSSNVPDGMGKATLLQGRVKRCARSRWPARA